MYKIKYTGQGLCACKLVLITYVQSHCKGIFILRKKCSDQINNVCNKQCSLINKIMMTMLMSPNYM